MFISDNNDNNDNYYGKFHNCEEIINSGTKQSVCLKLHAFWVSTAFEFKLRLLCDSLKKYVLYKLCPNRKCEADVTLCYSG